MKKIYQKRLFWTLGGGSIGGFWYSYEFTRPDSYRTESIGEAISYILMPGIAVISLMVLGWAVWTHFHEKK